MKKFCLQYGRCIKILKRFLVYFIVSCTNLLDIYIQMLEVLTVPLNLSLITLFSVTLCGVDLVDFENLHKLYNIAPCVDSCQGMILHSCIHLIFGLLLHQHLSLPDTILIVLSETGKISYWVYKFISDGVSKSL